MFPEAESLLPEPTGMRCLVFFNQQVSFDFPRTFSSFSCTKWEGKKKKESANWDAQGQVQQTVS